METSLQQLELLLRVADLSSFTLAAVAAGVSPAAVSKAVGRLERRLGVKLFERTTRHMRLTDAGARYVEACRTALRTLQDAERLATDSQTVAAGTLRFSLPTPYAHWRVLPLMTEFRRRYPAISISVHISNHAVSLAGDRFDVAIRGSRPADSGMVARKIEDAELVIVASPDYLRASPPLDVPADLDHHQCIQFLLPRTGMPAGWAFLQGGVEKQYMGKGPITCEDEYLGGLTLARHGAGVYQMYRFAVQDDLAAGRLVELLPNYGGATRPFYMIFARQPVQPAPLRAFIDFFIEALQR